MAGLQVELSRTSHGATFGTRPGVGDGTLEGIGSLAMLSSALQACKIGEFGYPVPRTFLKDPNAYVRLISASDVLSEGERLVEEIDVWYRKAFARAERAARRGK